MHPTLGVGWPIRMRLWTARVVLMEWAGTCGAANAPGDPAIRRTTSAALYGSPRGGHSPIEVSAAYA